MGAAATAATGTSTTGELSTAAAPPCSQCVFVGWGWGESVTTALKALDDASRCGDVDVARSFSDD